MTKKQKYLWKYLTLDKFESLINHEALFLPSLTYLQNSMDPWEGKTLDCFIAKFEHKTKKLPNTDTTHTYIEFGKIFTEKMITSFLDNLFIYSLNCDKDENYALWNIYTTNLKGNLDKKNGIAIRFKSEAFENLFINKDIPIFDSSFGSLEVEKKELKDIIYKTNKEIISILNDDREISFEKSIELFNSAYLIKNDYYSFAKEKRYAVTVSRFSEFKNGNKENIWLKCNLNELFNYEYCNIIISPYASTELSLQIYQLLENKNIRNIDKIVKKSNIILPC